MSSETIESDELDIESVLGSSVERREDPSLITGEAEYTDDIQRPKMTHMAVLRSQHGHAEISDIDTSTAEAMDGVVGVYTADDLDVPGEVPTGWLLPDLKTPSHTILAKDRVRYQGDGIAVVVAEENAIAHDAVAAIDVDYNRLDAVTDPKEAVEDDAPVLHEPTEDPTDTEDDEEIGTVPGNQAFDWEIGDADATDEAFASAAHTAEVDLENQRLIPNPMEPRAAMAEYKPGTEELELHMTSQNPHLHRQLMSGVLDVPEHKIHVVAPDVGGGFGNKIAHYPDEALVSWCAKETERPVKWTATRSESYLTGTHGRDHDTHAELAMDGDGVITGMRVETYASMGAYLSTFAPAIPTYLYGTLLSGQYDIPAIHCHVIGAFTNSAPTDAYRGAGRPEALYVVERMITLGAREVGMDPAEFRRQNFIPEDDFPHQTPVAVSYDSGDYEPALDKALDMVGYDDLRERQEELREEGRYLGIGFSNYIEACGLAPSELAGQLGAQAGLWESGLVRVHPTGKVTAFCGTSGHGQGHETTYAQIVSDELGIPYDDIEIVEGDTDEIPQGMGTYGSRSAAVGGSALATSSQKVVEKAKKIAAHLMEAGEEDIEFKNGEFSVAGAPERSMDIQEIAGQAYLAHDMPEGIEPGLEETSFYDPDNFVFPFGTHVAVVEVDPETGEIEFENYVAVDDVGPQINPKIVEGQVHGGVAQGIGQAMYEGAVYDDNGQLTTGSMQDYTVPKAEHIPRMETDSTVTPSPHNPLGVKGVGEAGTIAAPQAVVNAVTDALQPFGVDHIDMPLSSETVWQAVNDSAATDGGTDDSDVAEGGGD
ncbi:xanthine dehydrogenase family protein molybdopterin-binding subunit (plasmid) [Halococcus dombrowskii]|uniref:Xanthine dehydrogenase family protein molybdopterin-binding subunit n=1 Tax=Halococcus dombrowskii TaxID=179637 RepID=A0AAV3SKJ3_HALDO|nr:molybdopterin cofactor-binding domain-containing protein [Halococcus dombrowskii]UOO97005.1 xanthine dehydrogenase family protein molybdopterin-binding subunit [Halococcus dombrowskii]